MVPGHWKPGHVQLVHRRAELLHLPHPGVRLVVAIHQIAHRHDQVGIEQIGVLDRLCQNLDSFRRPAGAIAENDEVKYVVTFWQRQHLLRRAAGMNMWLTRRGQCR